MKVTLSVPESVRDKIAPLVEGDNAPFEIVNEKAQIRITDPGERLQSLKNRLYVGGWITCAVALTMASELGARPGDIGTLANRLEIKIRSCSLGCFD